jgi:outer membrane protein assembly factor BamB
MRFSSRFVMNIMLSLLVISALGLALLISRRGAAHATGASMQLSQTVGPPTTVVTVSGTGFGPNETITILCLAQVVGTTTSSSIGTFSTSIKIPASALPGFHEVKASGQSSGLTASSSFNVRTDWSQFGFEAHHRGFNSYENVLSPSNVSGLKLDWSYTTGIHNDYYSSSPAVASGLVYIGSDKLYALDIKTGVLKWSYTTGSDVSTPAVFNGVVYVGSDKLYALDARTGALKWSSPMGGGRSIDPPTVANGLVYIGSIDNHVYALDMTTGALKWNYLITEAFTAPLAVTRQIVYVGSSAAKLYAIDALMGTLKWSYSIKATSNTISASPVVGNGIVYVGSNDQNGQATKLYALNATTGKFEWSYDVGGCGIENAPALANGILYIGSVKSDGEYDNCSIYSPNLYALNATTGASIWSTGIGGSASAHNTSPVVANGVLYISSNEIDHGNGLYWNAFAINLKTGTQLWSYYSPYYADLILASSPVVANGVVYVDAGWPGNNFYAFHLPGTTP